MALTPTDQDEVADGSRRDEAPPVGTSLQYWTAEYGPFSALVTRVNRDGSLELHIEKPNGQQFVASSVTPRPSGSLGHYYKTKPIARYYLRQLRKEVRKMLQEELEKLR